MFTDEDTGEVEDPTTVTFKAKPPTDDAISYVYDTDDELVRDSEGCYHVDLLLDDDGSWYIRWEGSGGSRDVASEATLTCVVPKYSGW